MDAKEKTKVENEAYERAAEIADKVAMKGDTRWERRLCQSAAREIRDLKKEGKE